MDGRTATKVVVAFDINSVFEETRQEEARPTLLLTVHRFSPLPHSLDVPRRLLCLVRFKPLRDYEATVDAKSLEVIDTSPGASSMQHVKRQTMSVCDPMGVGYLTAM